MNIFTLFCLESIVLFGGVFPLVRRGLSELLGPYFFFFQVPVFAFGFTKDIPSVKNYFIDLSLVYDFMHAIGQKSAKIVPNMRAIMCPTNNWVNNRFTQRWAKLKYPTANLLKFGLKKNWLPKSGRIHYMYVKRYPPVG